MRLIAGSGRSGTTWVLDCVADANELRPVFEPLHPDITEIGANYAYRFIEPQESHPELQRHLESIQDPRHWSLWTTYRTPRAKLFPPISTLKSSSDLKHLKYRWSQLLKNLQPLHRAAKRKCPIIKCIRANLALGWFAKNFGSRVIMIVRHPGAVVESQFRLGSDGEAWNPSPILDRFTGDDVLAARTGGKYYAMLGRHMTKLEALTLVWVIENQMAVEHASDLGYSIIYYEELLSSPDTQWRRICDVLELANVPTPSRLRRPSQQASNKNSADQMGLDSKWMTRLNPKQLDQMQGILDATGCAIYDMQSAFPTGHRPIAASNG